MHGDQGLGCFGHGRLSEQNRTEQCSESNTMWVCNGVTCILKGQMLLSLARFSISISDV